MPRFVNFVSNAIQTNLAQQTGGSHRAGRASSSWSEDRAGGGSAADFADALKSASSKPEPTKAEAKDAEASAAEEKKPVRGKKADKAEKKRRDEAEPATTEHVAGAAGAAARPVAPSDADSAADAEAEPHGDGEGSLESHAEDEVESEGNALLASMVAPAGAPAASADVDAEMGETSDAATANPDGRKVVAYAADAVVADAADADDTAAAGEAVAQTAEEGDIALPKGLGLPSDDEASADGSLPETTAQTAIAPKAVENAGEGSPHSKDANASATGIFTEDADDVSTGDAEAQTASDDATLPDDTAEPAGVIPELPEDPTASATPTAPAPATTHGTAGGSPELSVAAPSGPASTHASHPTASAASQAPATAPTPQDFADANHSKIVAGVRGELMPNGGSMQIRLTPDNLGPLDVSIKMQDGVMTASFQTSNDEATRLLSHSLGQLKHALESQGVTVDRLQVQQAPRDQNAANDGNNDGSRQQQRQEQYEEARQEQQRKELLRRMWDRLAGGGDPLDLVA